MDSSIENLSFSDRPRDVNIVEFVQQRALEISKLMAVIDNKDLPRGEVAQGPRTFIQRQPRHMRRRAMSYNSKRLPRQRRKMALDFINEHKHRKKPPCRYYRRKPGNLLKAYANRKRKTKWLETHIWHAKRFHMVDQYGWKLPNRSCHRGFRASYRDAVKHCVIEDLSYYSCLELNGPEENLIRILNQMCPPNVGLSFKSVMFIEGQAEGSTILYEPGKYPYGCLGKVSFMWKPRESSDRRCLWIFVHPSLTSELSSFIIKLFALKMMTDSQDVEQEIYENCELNVKFQALKENLSRFRLIGPKSTSILSETFVQLKNFSSSKFTNCNGQSTIWDSWTSIYSKLEPGRVKRGKIISLIVEDPRLKLDYKKKIPPHPDSIINCLLPNDSVNLAESPIWSSSVCDEVRNCKTKDSELNKMRSEYSLIQKQLDSSIIEPNAIPILLCHQPGGERGFGSGWDVILPTGWGMPFWLAFQYRTSHAIGLQAHDMILFESGYMQFPVFYPDTASGKEYMNSISKKLKEKFLLRPFNRRIKYAKLKIKYPFCNPWLELVNGWRRDNDNKDFFVLRDRKQLTFLRKSIKCGQKVDESSFWVENANAIVPVKIVSLRKGISRSNALICLPNEEDLQTINGFSLLEPSNGQHSVEASPEKQLRLDGFQEDYISFDSGLGAEIDFDTLFVDKFEQKLLNRKLKDKQRKKRKKYGLTHARLPGENDHGEWSERNVAFSCSRSIIGFVVVGDYSFSIGKSVGLGFCSALALKEYLNLSRFKINNRFTNVVLLRNTNSKLYRACSLEIIV